MKQRKNKGKAMSDQTSMQWHDLIYSQRDEQWMEWNKTLACHIATIFGISPQDLGLGTVEGTATLVTLDEVERTLVKRLGGEVP